MISSVGSFNATNFVATAGLNRTPAKTDDIASAVGNKTSAVDTFKNYMKMSPAERMADNWLKSHGLTQAKLDAMSPSEREAIMKQMKQEIEEQLKAQTEKKGQVVDVTA